jgi:hypothetical protein
VGLMAATSRRTTSGNMVVFKLMGILEERKVVCVCLVVWKYCRGKIPLLLNAMMMVQFGNETGSKNTAAGTAEIFCT